MDDTTDLKSDELNAQVEQLLSNSETQPMLTTSDPWMTAPNTTEVKDKEAPGSNLDLDLEEVRIQYCHVFGLILVISRVFLRLENHVILIV